MKKVLLLLLLLGLGTAAVVLGLACSANPTGPNLVAPIQTVQSGNGTLTLTPTTTFTVTFTITPTPTNSSTPLPVVTVTWGNFGTYPFSNPSAIAVQGTSSIYVYVADTGNNRVEKFTNTGSLVTSWGAGGKGKGTINFTDPLAVAVNSIGTTLFVAGPNSIGVFDGSGNYLTSFDAGNVSSPQGLAVDNSGNLFISDTGHNRIRKLSPSGTPVSGFGISGNAALGSGVTGIGVAVYSTGSIVAVAVNQGSNNTPGNFDHVYLYDSGAGSASATIDGFYLPTGVAFDPGGDLFVVDTGHASVEEFSAPSPYQAPGVEINPNGTWTYPASDPRGVAVDSTGEIYVVDAKANTVYNFAP